MFIVLYLACVGAISGQLSKRTMNQLSAMGFEVVFSLVEKDAADKAILSTMLFWLWDKARATIGRHDAAQPCLILITADDGFGPCLR